MTRRTTITGLAAAVLLAALPLVTGACGEPVSATPALGESGTSNASLAGTWAFNRELSDCPDATQQRDRERIRDGSGNGPAGEGQRHHQHGGGPPGTGPRGESGGVCATDAPARLTISVTDVGVTFTHDDRSRTLPTDGSAITRDGRAGEVSVSGAWVDGALVETHLTPHGTMTVTFTVSDDGSQLSMTRRVEPAADDRVPRAVTHMWDRVSS